MCLFKTPEQLSFDLERTDALESYKVGYNTGINWDASWPPGGPALHTGKTAALREQSQRNYDGWHEGFKRGLKLRMENPYFAVWYAEFSRKGGYHRYRVPETLNEEMA